jgi:Na+-translocating ferredoxin:NAD+ oxidoreductase RNF subunit RnfB
MNLLIPILTLGCLGLIFGIGLGFASKRLAVQVDPRLEKIHGLLPGSNCGACGGAGCFGFAEMLLSGKKSVEACRISEEAVKEKIAHLLGKDLERQVRKVAVSHCYGGTRVKSRFIYRGTESCVSANLLLGGVKDCVFGCLGYGDCARICPFGAIVMSEEKLPIVDKDKCKACNKCVLICPKRLFILTKSTHPVYVACSSQDPGRDTKSVCPVGCIACGLCVKVCPVDAIRVVDNLAVIDYHKCIVCGKCVEACPMHTIRIRK